MERAKSVVQKLNSSRILFALILLAVFGVMLVGNFLTDKCADDYAYMFSFADGSRIDSLSDIPASMAAHARTMNGRLIAHTFVQIFEMLPKSVFNVLNALLFVCSLGLCYVLCVPKGTRHNFLLLGLFAAIWIYEPSFGQVNFWLDGSCNYLWMSVFTLLFILPYVRHFCGERSLLDGKAGWLMVPYGLFAGACVENLSGAVIFMAILFLAAERFLQKKTVRPVQWLPICTEVCGYACMVFAPGEQQNKGSGLEPLRLLYQFEKVMDRFHFCGVIVAAFVILLFAAVSQRIDKTRLLTAVVFGCGGFGAGFLFVLTKYYPGRCLAGCTLLLTIACGVLLYALLQGERFRLHALCLLTLLTLSLCYWCPHGIKDMYLMHEAVQTSTAQITAQKAAGETALHVAVPVPETKYCAFEGLVYLSPTDANHISNRSMAKYYGVDAVFGDVPPEVQ